MGQLPDGSAAAAQLTLAALHCAVHVLMATTMAGLHIFNYMPIHTQCQCISALTCVCMYDRCVYDRHSLHALCTSLSCTLVEGISPAMIW